MKDSRNLIRQQKLLRKSLARPDLGKRKRKYCGSCHAPMQPLRTLENILTRRTLKIIYKEK
jgi:hypothetical protein